MSITIFNSNTGNSFEFDKDLIKYSSFLKENEYESQIVLNNIKEDYIFKLILEYLNLAKEINPKIRFYYSNIIDFKKDNSLLENNFIFQSGLDNNNLNKLIDAAISFGIITLINLCANKLNYNRL